MLSSRCLKDISGNFQHLEIISRVWRNIKAGLVDIGGMGQDREIELLSLEESISSRHARKEISTQIYR